MKLVNDITETAEKWKRDNRNFLIVVDNPKENNYHAALHGKYEEIYFSFYTDFLIQIAEEHPDFANMIYLAAKRIVEKKMSVFQDRP